MIICICRGKSEKDISKAIDAGARTVRDLQRCGIGDQCGSCHTSLRMMIAAAREQEVPVAAAQPCPNCSPSLVSASV